MSSEQTSKQSGESWGELRGETTNNFGLLLLEIMRWQQYEDAAISSRVTNTSRTHLNSGYNPDTLVFRVFVSLSDETQAQAA